MSCPATAACALPAERSAAPAGAPERLIVMVSGAPAAGKSTLAARLAPALGLPLIRKDDIKETLADALDGPDGDLAFSRRLGGAAMEVLWRLAAHCPATVIEANFRPASDYERERLRGLAARIVEVYCACPPEELARRFAARARTAHRAHPLRTLPADLLAEYGRPMGVGKVVEVDTSGSVDLGGLLRRLAPMIGRRSVSLDSQRC